MIVKVATSSHREAFLLKTSQNRELFDLFDGHITCGDDEDIKRGKPHPDLFLAAAKKLGADVTKAQSCLVFEDAPSGVQAALNANMQVIWVPDVNLVQDPELIAKASQVLRSLEDFVPEPFGLPSFE
ncbi:Pseudouridine-5'-phosphatase [Borealophlyctis nickersoniae]|nr:Pseudouridine-5'-phosphatase [Borealophlyctis nickersoniae]